jgi:ribosomal protein L39E
MPGQIGIVARETPAWIRRREKEIRVKFPSSKKQTSLPDFVLTMRPYRIVFQSAERKWPQRKTKTEICLEGPYKACSLDEAWFFC